MQTRSLRTLVKVAQVGSFIGAAEQLGMTLSALSMQMKALEAELGVDLFDRSVRPPRLTPLGRQVVEEAEGVLSREGRLLEICRPTEGLSGRYKLGFVTSAAVRLLPGFLKAARGGQAAFSVETGLSAVVQDKVLSGQLDAGVVTNADGLPAGLSARLLRREPFVFAAPRAMAEAGLEGQTFFHFMPGTGIGKLIAGAVGAPGDVVVLDNLEAIMECVARGLGFTLLPRPDVTRYATQDVAVLPGPEGLERRLELVVLKGSALARREAALARLFGVPESALAVEVSAP
ncbi:LysR family transcriptional regulator [Gymnodinialimonas ulvae]|uniref:LysR family transcriptional regulator n=1 Tax=Gymnodinialimonas ulvae TaxID=3126504 RepID=UPI0030A9EA0D